MFNSSLQPTSPLTPEEHNKKVYAVIGSFLIIAIAMWAVGRLAFPEKYQTSLISSGGSAFGTQNEVYRVKPGADVAVKIMARVASGQKLVAGKLTLGNLPSFAYTYGFTANPSLGGKVTSNFSTTPTDGRAIIVLYDLNFSSTELSEIGTLTFKISDGIRPTDVELLGGEGIFTTEMTLVDANNTPKLTQFPKATFFQINVEPGIPTGTPSPTPTTGACIQPPDCYCTTTGVRCEYNEAPANLCACPSPTPPPVTCNTCAQKNLLFLCRSPLDRDGSSAYCSPTNVNPPSGPGVFPESNVCEVCIPNTTTPAPPKNCKLLRGDLNCDGRADLADLAQLSDYLTKLNIKLIPEQVVNADVTGDKKVDLADISKLSDYIRLTIDKL